MMSLNSHQQLLDLCLVGIHHPGAQWSGQLPSIETCSPYYQQPHGEDCLYMYVQYTYSVTYTMSHSTTAAGVGVLPPLPVQPGVLGTVYMTQEEQY